MSLLAVPLFGVGLVVYGWLAARSTARGEIELVGLLLVLAVIVALMVLLLALHEGVHAVVMRMFGAHTPRFGVTIAGFMPALYTTAPGHLFSRPAYVTVLAMPTIVISLVGALACLTPPGLILVGPLALHLSGCSGDLVAIARVLREPPGTRCEDRKAGIGFYRPTPAG